MKNEKDETPVTKLKAAADKWFAVNLLTSPSDASWLLAKIQKPPPRPR